MKSAYRNPVWEEGKHNLILQNRCGNRLTLMVGSQESELEFVYKPNAFRRKDFRARNFSNRDNQSTLFADFRVHDLGSEAARFSFDYDPFCTRLQFSHENGALNLIQILNIADENAFVITARAPLLLAFRPHRAFELSDGLLTERIADRGEEFVSFIRFPGFEANRFRVLDNGVHLLQVLENDPIIIGGEENRAQVDRVLRKLDGQGFDSLLTLNESTLAHDLEPARLELADPDFQKVFDLNRRICWSGIDAGGAAFGALNRIYYLIWVRDGSMSTSHLALAGHPEFSRIWAPFLLANPSDTLGPNGQRIREFGQLVGTRWSKSEDDGLFYAVWSLFTYTRITGDDRLLRRGTLDLLFKITDDHLAKCWDSEREVMTSDTLGEESLKGSPYFSFDVVNGSLQAAHSNTSKDGKTYRRVASFYHQVNTYNVLRMLECLAAIEGSNDAKETASRFGKRADALRESLRLRFVDASGIPFSLWAFYTDGSEEKVAYNPKIIDNWEYSWAQAQGPFYPLPEAQRKGALAVFRQWPLMQDRSYGLCPWNVLNRFLFRERLLSSAEADNALRDQVAEALTLCEKYPMVGALHEDHRNTQNHRGLPFSAGSFVVALTGRLLLPLAQGLAISTGGLSRSLRGFRYRLASIDVDLHGTGQHIAEWSLNGERFSKSLQIPESALLSGRNQLTISLTESPKELSARLVFSDAQLLYCQESAQQTLWRFQSAVSAEIVFDSVPANWQPIAQDAAGNPIPLQISPQDAHGLVRVQCPAHGAFTLIG